MITIRSPEEIYRAHGEIDNGTFDGRWHFSFGPYYDDRHMQFGTLRVFNDDTLSPGAVWPLHPHRNIEVVTYCAAGEFRHADQHGEGGVLKKGWVQHTTVGQGMMHSEINEREDIPMRFIQMWFVPSRPDLEPSVEQREVERPERTDHWLLLVSDRNSDGLPIVSDAQVYSCFLEKGRTVEHAFEPKRGGYLYVVEGGPAEIWELVVPEFGAVKMIDEKQLVLKAQKDTELLLIDTAL